QRARRAGLAEQERLDTAACGPSRGGAGGENERPGSSEEVHCRSLASVCHPSPFQPIPLCPRALSRADPFGSFGLEQASHPRQRGKVTPSGQ
ncbi:MAG TPA: hypothetical protein VF043_18345, partial [Ktedonobacteraceae bacterium]